MLVLGSAVDGCGGHAQDIATVPASVGDGDLVRGGEFDWRYMLGAITSVARAGAESVSSVR